MTTSIIRAAAAVAVAAGVFTAAASAVTDPTGATAVEGRPRIFVWGDGTFIGRAEFESWLRRHGESYTAWAPAHPAARAILALAATPLGFRPSQQAAVQQARQQEPLAPLVVERASARRPLSLSALLLAVAGAIVVLALLPLPRVRPDAPFAVAVEQSRVPLAAAGAAILVGVGIAQLISS